MPSFDSDLQRLESLLGQLEQSGGYGKSSAKKSASGLAQKRSGAAAKKRSAHALSRSSAQKRSASQSASAKPKSKGPARVGKTKKLAKKGMQHGGKSESEYRYFTLVEHDGKKTRTGRYKVKKEDGTPADAAQKAFSKLCSAEKKKDCSKTVAVEEITRGHGGKVYKYKASRKVKGKPRVHTFKDTGHKATFIDYDYNLKSVKNKNNKQSGGWSFYS